jgi:hypothetical protein
MVKGKVLKKGGKALLESAKDAGLKGGGAVAAENAIDALDNPYLAAAEGAVVGYIASGGNPIGAIAGGLVGFVLADGERITPCDMVAIPAYQYSAMLDGREPTFQIFIKEGEMIAPILPTDFMQANLAADAIRMSDTKPKRKLSAWQKYLASDSNKIFFKSGKNKGKLNMVKMGKAWKKSKSNPKNKGK